MYKTVKQGENSLQYTILPQTEEVLINSGVKGRGRDYSPVNDGAKKIDKGIIVWCLVFFACVGLLASAIALYDLKPANEPRNICDEPWLRQTIKPSAQDMIDHLKKSKLTVIIIHNSTTQHPDLLTTVSDSNEEINIKTTVTVKPSEATPELTAKWEQITPTKVKDVLPSCTIYPLEVTDYTKTITPSSTLEKTSYFPTHQRQSNNDLMLKHESWSDYDDDDDDEDYDVTKTPVAFSSKTNKPSQLIADNSIFESATQIVLTTPPSVVFTTSPNQNVSTNNHSTNPSVDDKDRDRNRVKSKMDAVKFKETKERILDDDDEDDEYKEPLADEDDVSEQTKGDDVKIKAQTKSWLQIRWPFVDTSSYFQWTGYSARDNLLLPAILSAALSALLVLAVLCYALRRRQRCKRRNQEIGHLTSELQAENLLTAVEHSSEDE